MLIFVSVALKLYTSNLLQSRIYHTEQVLCSLYYSMKMVQMVEYCNVFSLNILVAVTKGMSSVNLCSNRIFQLTWGASICIMAVKCWLLSYKVVSCTLFCTNTLVWWLWHTVWFTCVRAVMQRSLCGILWMSLEAAFNIQIVQMFVSFHSVIYQPRRHLLSCGQWLISTREVSDMFMLVKYLWLSVNA